MLESFWEIGPAPHAHSRSIVIMRKVKWSRPRRFVPLFVVPCSIVLSGRWFIIIRGQLSPFHRAQQFDRLSQVLTPPFIRRQSTRQLRLRLIPNRPSSYQPKHLPAANRRCCFL